MSRLAGKVALISGGASGIGAATAARLVAEGGKVVIGDVNTTLGSEVAAGLGTDNAAFTELDVRSPGSCAAAVAFAVDRFGTVDCVLNSAIRMAPGMLAELPLDDWNTMLEVGLTGTFLVTQAAGRWMIANGRPGSIVAVSSIGGRQPYGRSGAYSTVKSAVIMLARHFAIEWASRGIRVNAVCPGHVETPLTAYLKDPEIKAKRSALTPLGRVGQPDDVAGTVAFLFSDDADYITAAAIDVDGGLGSTVMNHMPGRTWS